MSHIIYIYTVLTILIHNSMFKLVKYERINQRLIEKYRIDSISLPFILKICGFAIYYIVGLLIMTLMPKRVYNLTINYRKYGKPLSMHIQWNLSKADTLGTNIFVRFRQVSALDRLDSGTLTRKLIFLDKIFCPL